MPGSLFSSRTMQSAMLWLATTALAAALTFLVSDHRDSQVEKILTDKQQTMRGLLREARERLAVGNSLDYFALCFSRRAYQQHHLSDPQQIDLVEALFDGDDPPTPGDFDDGDPPTTRNQCTAPLPPTIEFQPETSHPDGPIHAVHAIVAVDPSTYHLVLRVSHAAQAPTRHRLLLHAWNPLVSIDLTVAFEGDGSHGIRAPAVRKLNAIALATDAAMGRLNQKIGSLAAAIEARRLAVTAAPDARLATWYRVSLPRTLVQFGLDATFHAYDTSADANRVFNARARGIELQSFDPRTLSAMTTTLARERLGVTIARRSNAAVPGADARREGAAWTVMQLWPNHYAGAFVESQQTQRRDALCDNPARGRFLRWLCPLARPFIEYERGRLYSAWLQRFDDCTLQPGEALYGESETWCRSADAHPADPVAREVVGLLHHHTDADADHPAIVSQLGIFHSPDAFATAFDEENLLFASRAVLATGAFLIISGLLFAWSRAGQRTHAAMDRLDRLHHFFMHDALGHMTLVRSRINELAEVDSGAVRRRLSRRQQGSIDYIRELLRVVYDKDGMQAAVQASRGESEKTFDLGALVEEVMENLADAFGASRASLFSVEPDVRVWDGDTLRGEKLQLYIAVENVLKNALQHRADGSTVSVRWVESEGRLIVCNAVDAERAAALARAGDRLFDLGRRRPATATAAGHRRRGLGLHMAREVAAGFGMQLSIGAANGRAIVELRKAGEGAALRPAAGLAARPWRALREAALSAGGALARRRT